LGYTFGRGYSPKTGRAYLGTIPSQKRVIRICQAISSETERSKTLQETKTVVERLNRKMVGWANYFCMGPVSKAYRAVEQHARERLRQWLCAKHDVAGRATTRLWGSTKHTCIPPGLAERNLPVLARSRCLRLILCAILSSTT
jgi:Group II intron, maturase-specific domain